MNWLSQDLRYALRSLGKAPGFAAAAVATLALGIGANTAVSSVVSTLLVHPMPYVDSDRVVTIRNNGDAGGALVSPEQFETLQGLSMFEHVAAHYAPGFVYQGREGPRQIWVGVCSPELFETMRVRPAFGRLPIAGTATSGVVLSHSFWRTELGGDPSVVGRSLGLNGASHVILGVLPRDFRYPVAPVELWLPQPVRPVDFAPGVRALEITARLRPGVSHRRAGLALAALADQPPRRSTGASRPTLTLAPARIQFAGPLRPVLRALRLTVALVLLIACVNVTSLLLARVIARRQELAVRVALGASARRLALHALTEGLVLAAAGGVAALPLAWLGLNALVRFAPVRFGDVGIPPARMDGFVLLFTALAALLAALLSALLPALWISRTSAQGFLRHTRDHSGGVWRRSALITLETSFALAVVFLSLLMVRSFRRLQAVDLGLNTDRILAFELQLPPNRYETVRSRRAFFGDLYARLSEQPGVEAVAGSLLTPLGGFAAERGFSISAPGRSAGGEQSAEFRNVTPGYFRTLRIPMLRGRDFAEQDDDRAPLVVVVSRALSERLAGDPIGQRLRITFPGAHVDAEIVGVAADARLIAPDRRPPPVIYVSYLQRPVPFMTLLIRGSADAKALAAAVREQLRAIDPAQPLGRIATLGEVLEERVAMRKLQVVLFGLFAGLSWVLGAVGVFGQVSYSVARRRREIGIRLAVGATRARVVGQLLTRSLKAAAAGAAGGAVLAIALGHAASRLLYEVEPADPGSLATAVSLLLATAAAASLVPALAGARINPAETLRTE